MITFHQLRETLFGAPDIASLPERVQEDVERKEWANEVFLRLIHLAIIILFCMIYTVAPKTFPDGAFAPAPYVLAIFLVLSVTGLTWSLFRLPPDWAAYLSILFDFTLLYGLMVSFHMQYMQPPSFILKAPSLLYVFIFIAIRALRFHPKFVIVAGLVAATGWTSIILYVTNFDTTDSMLTRSYVEYLTSNTILIGAEVDKMVSILFVTGILALAINGSKNLLIRSVTEQTAAKDLSKFFDTRVAEGIRKNKLQMVAGAGEKRLATIMNIDIRGFTQLVADRDADQVMQLLSAYQSRVIPIIQEFGGTIDKFMGDGVMVTFGIGDDEENPAARAVAAAERILGEAAQWSEQEEAIREFGPIAIGVGIATGIVSWGAVGYGDRLELTVIGASVNLSAKLEKLNRTLGSSCICDAQTWKSAAEQGYDGALTRAELRTAVEGAGAAVDVVVLGMAPIEAASDKAAETIKRGL
ncbi:adenylate/guanylate cyclase domain-containing protein [Hoeflea sp. CAU 1731]